jgi:hypothetical protein
MDYLRLSSRQIYPFYVLVIVKAFSRVQMKERGFVLGVFMVVSRLALVNGGSQPRNDRELLGFYLAVTPDERKLLFASTAMMDPFPRTSRAICVFRDNDDFCVTSAIRAKRARQRGIFSIRGSHTI